MCEVMKLGIRGYSSVLHVQEQRTVSCKSASPPNKRRQYHRGFYSNSPIPAFYSQTQRRARSVSRTRPPSVVSLIYDHNWSIRNSFEPNNRLLPVAFALVPLTSFPQSRPQPQPTQLRRWLSDSTLSLSSLKSVTRSESSCSIYIDPDYADWKGLQAPSPKLTIKDIVFVSPEPECPRNIRTVIT